MKLSKYYRKEHVGEDCYVLYNTYALLISALLL